MPYLRRKEALAIGAAAVEVVPAPDANHQRRVVRMVCTDDGGNAAEAEVSVNLRSADIVGTFVLDYAFEPMSAAVGAAGNVAISRLEDVLILPGESIWATAATGGTATVTWVDEPLE